MIIRFLVEFGQKSLTNNLFSNNQLYFSLDIVLLLSHFTIYILLFSTFWQLCPQELSWNQVSINFQCHSSPFVKRELWKYFLFDLVSKTQLCIDWEVRDNITKNWQYIVDISFLLSTHFTTCYGVQSNQHRKKIVQSPILDIFRFHAISK